MQRTLSWAAPVLACCAIGLTALNVRREVHIRQNTWPKHVADWTKYAATGNHLGPQGAPVSLVVFTDYECPFCRQLSESLRVLNPQLAAKVRVTYRNYPLSAHTHAFEAAVAAQCAAWQGRFRAFDSTLTTLPAGTLGRLAWPTLAAGSGITDQQKFAACLRSPVAISTVVADTIAGNRLGIPATPTLLINDKKYAGIPPNLSTLLAEAVERAKQ